MSSDKPYQIRTIHVRASLPYSVVNPSADQGSSKMATLYFFCGAGITHLLDRIVHRIGAWQKKKSATTRSFSETPRGDTPQGDFISETMQRRYAEGEFGEPSNFDIVGYNKATRKLIDQPTIQTIYFLHTNIFALPPHDGEFRYIYSGSELRDMVQCISIVFSVSTAAAVTGA
mgnify:CR=1 FL=1